MSVSVCVSVCNMPVLCVCVSGAVKAIKKFGVLCGPFEMLFGRKVR